MQRWFLSHTSWYPGHNVLFWHGAQAELATAQPLPGNSSKVPLARKTLVRTLLELLEEAHP